MPSMNPLLLLSFFFFLLQLRISSSPVLSSTSPAPSCSPSDRDALLLFKKGLSDPHKDLITWSTSKSCCLWHGITCDTSGRVTQLRLHVSAGRIQLNSSSPDLIGSTLSKLSRLEVLDLYNLQSVNSPLLLPVGLKNLRNLKALSLNEGDYSGSIPAEWSQILSLQKLDLSSNNDIIGQIPASFCSLSNLQTLNLAKTGPQKGLTGTIPDCFWEKLTKLVDLDLSYNSLTGNLPTSIGNLANLVSLKLTENSLTGPIPSSIGNLKALQILNLNGNTLSGSIPQSLGKLSNLRELRLGAAEEFGTPDSITRFNKQLGGTIPAGIGLPSRSLRVLRIRGTSVSGNIPDSLSQNNKLEQIYLDQNALTGGVPASLGLLKKLTTLNLASNRLSGSIPPQLARPKSKLTTLNIANNQLSGPIPATFSNLTLDSLDLSNNKLQGSIPDGLGNGLKFGTLSLANNKLTGAFPKSLWSVRTIDLSNNLLTSLPSGHLDDGSSSQTQELNLSFNQLSGTIPPWVFEFTVTSFLDLSSNKFVSPLPTIDANKISVQHVNISHNLLTGPIPEDWGNVQYLNTLDFSYNQFSGSIPSNFTAGSTFFNNLVLSHNRLSGPIPTAIFSSGFFNSLDLSHNQLSGPIPDSFPSTTPFLSFLDFSYNQLSGTIPPKLFTFSQFIVRIKLDHNQFTGPIPDLGDACNNGLQGLNFVTLNNNKFTGSLHGASWIPKCAGKLTVFDISGNNVGGEIPDFSTWTNIKVLSLANNKFTGTIPRTIFTSLPSLEVLDLSGNNLEGPTPFNLAGGLKALENSSSGDVKPSERGPYYQDGIIRTRNGIIESFDLTLKTAHAIDVSHNRLTGPIASEVGVLKGLQVLDLASNAFSGTLPQSLGTIPSLKILDLSHNGLSGSIPSNLRHFPASSFVGNPHLCGPPLSAVCH